MLYFKVSEIISKDNEKGDNGFFVQHHFISARHGSINPTVFVKWEILSVKIIVIQDGSVC